MTEHLNTALGAYVLGALAPGEHAAVERHLARCSSCATEHAALAGLRELLDATVGADPPPGHRTAAGIRATTQALVTRQTRRR